MKKCLKNTKGITLIALIITIIILLILAGVTISALTGNGLFEKAQQASDETKYANAAEKVSMAVMASYDESENLNDDSLKENLNNIDGINPKVEEVTYDLTVIVDGYEFIISEYGQITALGRSNGLPENTEDTEAGTEVALEDGWAIEAVSYIKTSDGTEITEVTKVATVYAISVGDAETVPVPYGFYYVGGNLETGVVISDNEADKYDGVTDKTTHEYATQLKGNQFVWIPCKAEDYKKIDWVKENAKWDMETNKAEKTQIEKYGGFYIGRYEAGVSTLNEETEEFEDSVTFSNSASLFGTVAIQTGIVSSWVGQNYNYTARQSGTIVTTGNDKATGNVVIKANSIPYYHSDYYTAVEMSERLYSNNSYVNSGLVTGTMWDMMMKYIQDVGGIDVTSTSWGNYDDVSLTNLRGYYTNVTTAWATNGFKSASELTTNSGTNSYVLLTTGSSEQVKKMNLYDVAGNLWEWIQETAYSGNDSSSNSTYNTYVLRGGSFHSAYSSNPACYRVFIYALHTHTAHGFRVALYIK